MELPHKYRSELDLQHSVCDKYFNIIIYLLFYGEWLSAER